MRKSEFGLASLVTLFALPFLAIMPLWALLKLNAILFPHDPPLGLVVALVLPFFFIIKLLSNVTHYLVFSLVALLLTLVVLVWLAVRKQRSCWLSCPDCLLLQARRCDE